MDRIRGDPKAAWTLAGRCAKTLEGLGDLIAANPDSGWAYALSAAAKLDGRVGRFSEALEDLEKARSLEPNSYWILGYQGRALASGGRLAEALQSLDGALSLEPKCPWILTERALVRLGLGDAAGARADAEASLSLAPGSCETRLAHAACLACSGLWPETLSAISRCSRLNSSSRLPVPPGAPRPNPDLLRFEAFRELGRWTLAASCLEKACRSGIRVSWTGSPGGPRDLLSGLDEIARAFSERPRNPWLHFWNGEANLRLGRTAEAEAEFTRAILLDKRHAWSWAWRGWTRTLAGNSVGAVGDLKTAPKLSPPPMLKAPLWALLGHAQRLAGRWTEALTSLSRAVSLDNENPVPRLNRAEVFLDLKKSAQAEEDLRTALEIDDAYAPAYWLRARQRRLRGDRDGMLSDAGRALNALGSVTDPKQLLSRALHSPQWIPGDPPGLDSAPAQGSRRPSGLKPAELPASAYPRYGQALVDPRIELAGLLKLLISGERVVPDFCRGVPGLADYLTQAGRFSRFLDEPIRARFSATAARTGNPRFPWLGITQMMMGLSEPPELKIETPAWRHGEDLALLALLRRFVKRSGFMSFFKSHARAFSAWTRPHRAIVEREAYARTVSSYVGLEVKGYYDVVVSPLLRGVSLRAILQTYDGARGARTVYCPLTSKHDFKTLLLRPDPRELLWTGWHELLHTPLDAWTGFYQREVSALKPLYSSVPASAKRKNWPDCFSEHLVRAATLRLLERRCGAMAAARLAQADRRAGYMYLDLALDGLKEFESARDRYPTLLDYFPRWLARWRSEGAPTAKPRPRGIGDKSSTRA